MPYIGLAETSSTITVTTSEDEITFAAATANAVLEESTPVRAVIREDYYWWAVYDNRMYRYRHDTGGSATGMAGNDYSAVQISGEWYWFPLTSSENTNSAAITAQLQDLTGPSITDALGAPEADWNIPLTLDATGTASDGAQHFGYNGDDTIKITADRDRTRHAVVLEPRFLRGDPSSPTDLLVGYWKCNDNAASTAIVDSTSTANATLKGGNNTEDVDSADAVQATSFLLGGIDGDAISLPVVQMTAARFINHTIIFKAKPGCSYDCDTDYEIYRCFLVDDNSDSDNTQEGYGHIRVFYDASVDCFTLQISFSGTITEISTGSYSSDTALRQWHTFLYSISSAYSLACFSVDGESSTAVLSGDAPTDGSVYRWSIKDYEAV